MDDELSYFEKIISFSRTLIDDLTNNDILSFLQEDKELLEQMFSLSYFILSKEFYILKNKAILTPDRLTSQIPQVDWDNSKSILPNFNYYPSDLSYIELIDRIRDSIMHCQSTFDFNQNQIVIDNNMQNRELKAEIPFDWFKQYMNLSLYDSVVKTDYSYILCRLVNPDLGAFLIKKKDLNSKLNLFKFFEVSFKSNNPFSIIDLRKDMVILLDKYMNDVLDNRVLEKYVKTAKTLGNDDKEIKKKLPLIRLLTSFELIREDLKEKYDIDFNYNFLDIPKEKVKSFLDFNDDTELSAIQVQHILSELNVSNSLLFLFDQEILKCFEASEEGFTKYPIELIDKITDRNKYQFIKEHKNQVIESILYSCFINCYNINKDSYSESDLNSIIIPDNIKVYKSDAYRLEADKRISLSIELNKARRLVNEYEQHYNNHPLEQVKERLEFYKNEEQRISNEIGSLKLSNPDNLVNEGGRDLLRIDSKEEIMTTIRNAFSHNGRVKYDSSNGGTIELFDFSDDNKLTGYVKTDIDSLFKFVSQDAFKDVIEAKKTRKN